MYLIMIVRYVTLHQYQTSRGTLLSISFYCQDFCLTISKSGSGYFRLLEERNQTNKFKPLGVNPAVLRKKSTGAITDNITNQQQHHEKSRQMYWQPCYQKVQLTRHQASHKQRHQANQQSKMQKDSSSEETCMCGGIDDADSITNEIITLKQQLVVNVQAARTLESTSLVQSLC